LIKFLKYIIKMTSFELSEYIHVKDIKTGKVYR